MSYMGHLSIDSFNPSLVRLEASPPLPSLGLGTSFNPSLVRLED